MDAIPSLELLPSLNVSMGPLVPVSVLSQIGATESPKRTQGVPIPPRSPPGLRKPMRDAVTLEIPEVSRIRSQCMWTSTGFRRARAGPGGRVHMSVRTWPGLVTAVSLWGHTVCAQCFLDAPAWLT